MNKRITVCFSVLAFLSIFGYCAAESRSEIYKEKEIVFVDEGKIVTLSLGRYDGGEGVITSPDKTLKGLPYVIGAMKYGYAQPYVFSREDGLSQAVLIPYMSGGGTGVAVGDWCLAVAEEGTVYVKPLGMWHYHCCGPRDDFFSFDISPSFSGAKGLSLSFLYEERKGGEIQFIKGDIALEIAVDKNNVETVLKPCRVEDALKIADLLTKYGCIKEWAFECLSQAFPKVMKDLSVDNVISSESIELLKSKIKRHYAK